MCLGPAVRDVPDAVRDVPGIAAAAAAAAAAVCVCAVESVCWVCVCLR